LDSPSVFRSNVGANLRSLRRTTSPRGATRSPQWRPRPVTAVSSSSRSSDCSRPMAECARSQRVPGRQTKSGVRTEGVPARARTGPTGNTVAQSCVEHVSCHITALRAKLQAVGKYDMLTFVIKVLDLAPGERTAMEIPHEPDAATIRSAMTSLYLPITVARAGRLRLLGAVLLAIVSLFFLFRPHIATVSTDVVRNIATVVFVLTMRDHHAPCPPHGRHFHGGLTSEDPRCQQRINKLRQGAAERRAAAYIDGRTVAIAEERVTGYKYAGGYTNSLDVLLRPSRWRSTISTRSASAPL